MTDMNAISGTNPFCGPAVIATIAGISTDEAERLLIEIRHKNGQNVKKITFVTGSELQKAFLHLGYSASFMSNVKGYSLYMLLMTKITTAGYYLFIINGHVVAIEIAPDGTRNICDNHSKKPIPASSSVWMMQKVLAVLKVNKK